MEVSPASNSRDTLWNIFQVNLMIAGMYFKKPANSQGQTKVCRGFLIIYNIFILVCILASFVRFSTMLTRVAGFDVTSIRTLYYVNLILYTTVNTVAFFWASWKGSWLQLLSKLKQIGSTLTNSNKVMSKSKLIIISVVTWVLIIGNQIFTVIRVIEQAESTRMFYPLEEDDAYFTIIQAVSLFVKNSQKSLATRPSLLLRLWRT